MTYDEEIIKEATEIYEKNHNAGALVGDLLRIIKSQKAEIERKTTECERLEIYMDELVKQKLNQAKSEAYKEFSEKLKEEYGEYDWEVKDLICTAEDIDNTLKKLIGESK